MNTQLAAQIVSSFFTEPVKTVAPIVGKGTVNRIFIVTTVEHEVVVRLNDAETAWQEYEKEKWCLEQASAKGIPGPEVLTLGKLGSVAYMLQTLISGDNGEDSHFDKTAIWRKLGQYAKIIHAIKIDPASNLQLPHFDNFELSWTDFLAYNIESLTPDDELIKYGVLSKAQAVTVRQLFEGLTCRTYHFGLCHRDIVLRNTIVAEDGLVSLLDYGSAEINIVPYTELATFLEWQLTENYPSQAEVSAFLAGYGISQAEFREIQPELETLTLLRAFDTLRWAIERSPSEIAGQVHTARKILEYKLSYGKTKNL
jgi:aminoglycoside phosphotransferase